MRSIPRGIYKKAHHRKKTTVSEGEARWWQRSCFSQSWGFYQDIMKSSTNKLRTLVKFNECKTLRRFLFCYDRVSCIASVIMCPNKLCLPFLPSRIRRQCRRAWGWSRSVDYVALSIQLILKRNSAWSCCISFLIYNTDDGKRRNILVQSLTYPTRRTPDISSEPAPVWAEWSTGSRLWPRRLPETRRPEIKSETEKFLKNENHIHGHDDFLVYISSTFCFFT